MENSACALQLILIALNVLHLPGNEIKKLKGSEPAG
jgi:hypothetical protein